MVSARPGRLMLLPFIVYRRTTFPVATRLSCASCVSVKLSLFGSVIVGLLAEHYSIRYSLDSVMMNINRKHVNRRSLLIDVQQYAPIRRSNTHLARMDEKRMFSSCLINFAKLAYMLANMDNAHASFDRTSIGISILP